MTPRVTVGLPVYNGEPYLAEAIDSVLAQTFDDFELVISDNGSTDSTQRICTAFAARDERVTYHRSERNRGAAWNYNRLLDLARAPYFRWQAADDAIRPSFIGQCVRVLDTQPDVVLCYAPAEYVGPGGEHRKYVRNAESYAQAVSAHARIRSTLATTTHCFEVFGVMRTAEARKTRGIGSYPASDVVFLAELALLGRFAQLEEPLFVHRMHRGRSVFQHEDQRNLVNWYDPSAKRLIAPRWRLLGEFARAFATLPASRSARMSAVAALGPWVVRHRWQLGYDLAACTPAPVANRARAVRDERRKARADSKAAARGARL